MHRKILERETPVLEYGRWNINRTASTLWRAGNRREGGRYRKKKKLQQMWKLVRADNTEHGSRLNYSLFIKNCLFTLFHNFTDTLQDLCKASVNGLYLLGYVMCNSVSSHDILKIELIKYLKIKYEITPIIGILCSILKLYVISKVLWNKGSES